jgi:hypothetical protein
MPEYHELLNQCISRHDKILLPSSELLKDSHAANFVLRVTNDVSLSGKVMLVEG